MKIFLASAILAFCFCVQEARYSTYPPDHYEGFRPWPRILHGNDARLGQFPWQAEVRIRKPRGSIFCGGSLISSRWILTSANCVIRGLYYEVKVGGIYRTGSEPSSIQVYTSRAYVPETFNKIRPNNNIALIDLGQDLELTDYIQPVKLPRRSDVGKSLRNTKLTVSGWGWTSDRGYKPNTLQFVELDTISNFECKSFYFKSTTITPSSLCCRGRPSHSPCKGDSGSPLVQYDANGEATQVGVTSFLYKSGKNKTECSKGRPSVYVRTASFLYWISEITGIKIRD